MNEPRCDRIEWQERCPNQAAGWWSANGKPVWLCERHRDELADQGVGVVSKTWHSLVDIRTRTRIGSMLLKMAAGYFG